MSDDRTLPASPRRRAEAWRTGPTPRSSPLSTAAIVLTTAVYGSLCGGSLLWQSANWLRSQWLDVAQSPPSHDLPRLVQHSLWAGIGLICGLVLTGFAAAMAIELLQAGWRFNPAHMLPDPGRLIASGPRRILGGLSLGALLGESFRWLAPLALLLSILWSDWPRLNRLLAAPPTELPAVAGDVAWQLIWRLCGWLLACGLIHYVWVRWRWERSLQVSPEQQREEHRHDARRRVP
jgi:flagellar biosynthesis protein FlhB